MKYILAFLFLLILNLNASGQHISENQAVSDLDSLEHTLETYSSYLKANDFNYSKHIDSLKASISDSVSVYKFGLAIRDFIGQLQDSHSKVDLSEEAGLEDDFEGELPFPTAIISEKVVAIDTLFGGYLAPEYPFIKAINGIKLEELLKISGASYMGQSPQAFLSRAVDKLKDIEFVLSQANALDSNKLRIVLTNGRNDTTLNLSITESQPKKFSFDHVSSTLIEDEIAYLRIPEMYGKDFEHEKILQFGILRSVMESRAFAESKGMIIDVRGNGGGTRDILQYMLPYFIEEPIVYNAAIVKHDTASLRYRDLYSPNNQHLSLEEQKVVKEFAATFNPDWGYPKEQFLETLFVAVQSDQPTPYDYTSRHRING